MTITHDALDLTVQPQPWIPLDMGPHCTGTPALLDIEPHYVWTPPAPPSWTWEHTVQGRRLKTCSNFFI